MKKVLLLAAVMVAALSVPALAQENAPITDVAQRAHVVVNGAWLWIQPTTEGAPEWNAASGGAGLVYSLPRNVAVQLLYDHGWPAGDSHGKRRFVRAEGTLKIYPVAPEVSQTVIFVALGRSWFGAEGVDEFTSNDVKLILSRQVMPRLAVFGSYSRAFTTDDALADFDYAKVGLSYHLIGRE